MHAITPIRCEINVASTIYINCDRFMYIERLQIHQVVEWLCQWSTLRQTCAAAPLRFMMGSLRPFDFHRCHDLQSIHIIKMHRHNNMCKFLANTAMLPTLQDNQDARERPGAKRSEPYGLVLIVMAAYNIRQ